MTDDEAQRLVAQLKKLGVEGAEDSAALRDLMENPAAVCTTKDGATVKMPLLPPAGIPVIAVEVEEFRAIFFIPLDGAIVT